MPTLLHTPSPSGDGSRDHAVFEAGHVALQSGRTFRNLRLSYKTFGTLNAAKSNLIVCPTSYSAQHHDTQFMVREGGALRAAQPGLHRRRGACPDGRPGLP